MNSQPDIRVRVGDLTVIRFQSRKILNAGLIDERNEEISSDPPKDDPNTIFNFSEVQFISSGVLNKLIVLEKTISELTGRLILCGLTEPLWDLFSMTRLDQIFTIVENEADAVEQFSQDKD